jgi:hypothetical protein
MDKLWPKCLNFKYAMGTSHSIKYAIPFLRYQQAFLGAVGTERRVFSGFFSERIFGAAFTAVCRGVAGGGVDVAVATG